MARYLGQSDLDRLFAERLVTPLDCVDAVAASFREQGEADVGVLPRQIIWADPNCTVPRARALKMSAAYMRSSQLMGASIYAVHFAPGSIDMWLTVFSGTSGRMLGVINSKQLSVWKTAATAAVAARALARPDAKQLALIGTGSYALAQLTFLDAVLPFETIRCFSRTRATLTAFCGEAQKVLGRRVLAAESVREAVEDADVITTITTSPAPVLFGSWLPEGVHCNVMGQHSPDAREVDTEAVLRSRVFVDSIAQALDEKGELLVPMAQHVISQAHIVGELGAVLTGRLTGRTSAGDLTMFCSGGTAFEYMALCAMLLEKAEAAGIGQVLTP